MEDESKTDKGYHLSWTLKDQYNCEKNWDEAEDIRNWERKGGCWRSSTLKIGGDLVRLRDVKVRWQMWSIVKHGISMGSPQKRVCAMQRQSISNEIAICGKVSTVPWLFLTVLQLSFRNRERQPEGLTGASDGVRTSSKGLQEHGILHPHPSAPFPPGAEDVGSHVGLAPPAATSLPSPLLHLKLYLSSSIFSFFCL